MLTKKERRALVFDLAGYDQVAQGLHVELQSALASDMIEREVCEELYERRAVVLMDIADLEKELKRGKRR